jgi:hypothetical protein
MAKKKYVNYAYPSPHTVRLTDKDENILTALIKKGLAKRKSDAIRVAIRGYGEAQGITV